MTNDVDLERWLYPSFDVPNELTTTKTVESAHEHQQTSIQPEEPRPTEITLLEDNLRALQQTWLDKINLIDTLGNQLALLTKQIDADLLTNLIGLIKKATKKIILKELTLDPSLLDKMIKETLTQLHCDEEVAIVYVSLEDFAFFETYQSSNNVQFKMDCSLHKGDFKIQTAVSGVEALLNARLQALFGL